MEYEFTIPVYFMYILSEYQALAQLTERRAKRWAVPLQFLGEHCNREFLLTKL
jgi:hypothetical protein